MIFGASLDPEELEREKGVVLSELDRGEDSPGQRLFKAVQRQMWEGTPYARPVIGFRETVAAITRQDIEDYIGRFYHPQAMLCVVVGDVDPDAAAGQVAEVFGGLANQGPLQPIMPAPFAPAGKGPRLAVEHGPWNKAYLAASFPLPSLLSAQAPAADVLGHLLGGDQTSRLYRTFKTERRLVDEISASSFTLEQVGMLYIYATLDPGNVPRFWQELNEDLARLTAADFSDEEIARARLNIQDGLLRSMETLGGLASKIGYFQFYEKNPLAEENYLHAIGQVDRGDLSVLMDEVLGGRELAAALLLPNGTDMPEAGLRQAVEAAWPGVEAAAEPAAAAAAGKGAEIVEIAPGRTVALLPDDTLPYVSVDLVLGGGDALLAPNEQGLAALAAKALDKGTRRLSATAFQDFLAGRAADITASAQRDLFLVSTSFPARFEAEMLDLFAEVAAEPAFLPEEVANARREQTAEIARETDQPLGLAFRRIFPFLFTDSPYAYLHLGTPEGVAGLTPEDVRSFWQQQLARPWVLAACGRFDRKAVLAAARRIAKLAPGTDFVFPTATWGRDRALDLPLAERNQTHVIAAFPVPGSRDRAKSAGIDLLRQVLAGQGGILFRELRDKRGLAYTVTAMLWQAPETGFLALYIGTSPDKAEEAVLGFRDVIGTLQAEALPEETLNRAKNLLRGDYYREHQSLSSRSREAAGLLARGYAIDRNRQQVEAAQKLSPDDVRALAREVFDWDRAYILRVVP